MTGLALPTTYTSTNGRTQAISGMVTEHLQNAYAKLVRTGGDAALIQAIGAELTKRGIPA